MQISPLTIYAIQALQAIRKHGPLSGEEVAMRLDISSAYGKKALHVLKRAGLVRNDPDLRGYVVVGCPRLRQVVEATDAMLPDQGGETQAMRALRRCLRARMERGLGTYVSNL